MSSGDRDGEKTVRFLAGNALWLINARAGIDRAAAFKCNCGSLGSQWHRASFAASLFQLSPVDPQSQQEFVGAERVIQFQSDGISAVSNAIPLRCNFGDYLPENPRISNSVAWFLAAYSGDRIIRNFQNLKTHFSWCRSGDCEILLSTCCLRVCFNFQYIHGF